jgi:hypothetical protein
MPVLGSTGAAANPVAVRQLLSLHQAAAKMPIATVGRYFSRVELNVS